MAMGLTSQLAGADLTAANANLLPPAAAYLVTGTVSNSLAETVIGTFTIPAGDATSALGGYWWFVHAVTTETATPNLTIRVRLNGVAGTAIQGVVAANNTTPGIVQVEGKLGLEAIGAAGSFGVLSSVIHNLVGGGTTRTEAQLENVAINTTVSNTIVVTAQFSAANASNTATTKFGAMFRF